MYNNPYFNGFREPNNQQPIQNIINTQMPQNDLFMARFLKENEQAESQFITTKTAFIDLFRNELTIRDMAGDIKKYQIIPPLDEKDMKINALEQDNLTLKNEINKLKEMITNESNANIQSINASTQQTANATKSNRSKSSS